jgi:hypothetical protein
MPTIKKTTRAITIAIAVIMIIMTAGVTTAFAAPAESGNTQIPGIKALTLEESYPTDDDQHVPVDNIGFKLLFSGDVTADGVWANNEKSFEFTDSKNKKYGITVYPSPDDSKYILVSVNNTDSKGGRVQLAQKSDYKLTIKSGLASADGAQLADNIDINFTTIDLSGNTKIYMLMMVLMVVAMVGFSVLNNKRKAKFKAQTEAIKAMNPYKIAKDKKMTVEEANAYIEKEKEKVQKRMRKLGIVPEDEKKKEEEEKAKKAERPRDVKKVKAPHPISAAGSTYKTGRKAKAEAKAKKEAAKQKQQQNLPGTGKNSGGGKGKKKK